MTTDDVNLATKSYGPEVGGIKCKTTRSMPKPVVSNTVEIPDEFMQLQKDLTMSICGLIVRSLKIISTISHEL